MNRQPKHYSPFFILMSVVLSLMVSVIPFPQWLQLYIPEWVVLVIIFWIIMAPQKMGITSAWFIGLLVDVLTGSVLGEHAFVFTILAAIVSRYQRRLYFMSAWQQSMGILLFIIIYRILLLIIHGMLHSVELDAWFWMPAVTSMLFWPMLFWLLRGHKHMHSFA